ncbi:NTP transferase domain-containing protein [Parasphingopyxis sp. CP4]|nr:NTP transferase domain-containing protein [Parasphingopyxis sp. CP4]
MRAAIILAAGRSRRFGTANKLLTPIAGKALLARTIKAALREPVGRVLVMIGHDRQRIAGVVHSQGQGRVFPVQAADHALGHQYTLLAGLKSLSRHENEVLVFLADAPGVRRSVAGPLSRAARGKVAARAVQQHIPGHPVLIRDIPAVIRRIEEGKAPLDPATTGRVQVGRLAIADVDRPIDRHRFAEHGRS